MDMIKRSKGILVKMTHGEWSSYKSAATLAGSSLSMWIRIRLRTAALVELKKLGRTVPFLAEQYQAWKEVQEETRKELEMTLLKPVDSTDPICTEGTPEWIDLQNWMAPDNPYPLDGSVAARIRAGEKLEEIDMEQARRDYIAGGRGQ